MKTEHSTTEQSPDDEPVEYDDESAVETTTLAGTTAREQADDDSPLVTVVITTYNRPTYLRKAAESVRRQTYEPLELVVVDDHSEVPAERVLEEDSLEGFHEVKLIRHDENRGANAARNTGIRASSGEYIAFLDDDDQWAPEKVARQVEVFQEDDDIGVTYTALRTVNVQDAGVAIPPRVEGDITPTLLCRNVIGTLSAVMVSADIAREVKLDEQFPSWADLEWYINLSRRTTFRRISEPLVIYEYDSHNRLSEDLEKKQQAYERFITEFDELAAQYGPLCRRKMRGWAAYRLGSTALALHQYGHARRFLATAVRWYPLEPRFLKYFVATLGGRYTHDFARGIKRFISAVTT